MKTNQFIAVGLAVLFLFVGLQAGNAQWIRVGDLPSTDIPSIHVRGNSIFVATDSAVYSSSNGGTGWRRSATVPGSPCFIDALMMFDGKILVGTGGNGVFFSSNGGASWEPLNQGLSGAGSHHITSFAERDAVLYAGTAGAGVYRLTGTTWIPFGDLSGNAAGNVWFLRTKGDTVVAGAGGSGRVWYALPGATDWLGVLVAPLQGFEFLITAMVDYGSALIAGSTYGIFRSTDGGARWVLSSAGVPAGRQILLTTGGNNLYAAAQSVATRLYTSADGMTWTFVEQAPFCYAQAVLGNRIYAARLDGLWYKTLPTAETGEPHMQPNRIALNQNYPNPFNPKTNITFELQGSGVVSLKVFDLQGREVATLVSEKLSAGSYARTFDATGMASGVYYYTMTLDGVSRTRKMILVK
jgi:hypothetical protein